MDVLLSVSGIVIIAVMIVLACVLWKVAKFLLIPLQILLFLALVFVVYKLFFTPEKIDMLSKGIKENNMQEFVSETSKSAVDLMKKAESVMDGKNAGNVQNSVKTESPATVVVEKSAEKKADSFQPQRETAREASPRSDR